MSAAVPATRSFSPFAMAVPAYSSSARTGSICSFAAAGSPAGKATGAIAGSGNSDPPPPALQINPTAPFSTKEHFVGRDITLTASDKFQLGAYRAEPAAAPKGAVVV